MTLHFTFTFVIIFKKYFLLLKTELKYGLYLMIGWFASFTLVYRHIFIFYLFAEKRALFDAVGYFILMYFCEVAGEAPLFSAVSFSGN